MYNEEIKLRYLSEIKNETSKNICRLAFEYISDYEAKYEKDICCMSVDELSDSIRGLSVVQGGALNKGPRIQAIENYIKWCIYYEISGANSNIFSIEVDSTGKIKETMLKSPEHLNMVLNVLFKDVSLDTIDNVYRTAIWLIYSGIKKEELNNIHRENIMFNKGIILFDDKQYTIYDQSINSIESCINLTEFNMFRSANNKKPAIDPRAFGTSIVRTTSGDLDQTFLQQQISRKTNKYLKEGFVIPVLKLEKIKLSGLFYRCWQLEQQGADIDFTNIALSEMNSSGKTYRGKNSIVSRAKERARGISADYQRWVSIYYK